MRALFSNTYLLPLLLFCMFLNLRSQTVTDNELDKKYTPNSTSIFNKFTKKSNGTYSSSSPEVTFSNCIKFNPLLFLRQKIGIFYERKITGGLSVVGGIGKAFGPDAIQNFAYEINVSGLNSPPGNLSPSQIIGFSNYFSSGVLLSGSIKIYFSGNAFEESCVEFNYRRETMNYLLDPLKSKPYIIDGENLAKFKMSQFSFGYCFSGVTGKNNNIINEFYFNFGMKLFTFTEFETYRNTLAGSTTTESFIRTSGLNGSFKLVPSLNVGYSFGFGF